MRVKVDVRTGSPECYRDFKAKHPHIDISLQEWTEIIYQFNESFRNYLLETGDREKLPWGFGSFAITKKKRKAKKLAPNGKEYINLPIDWVKTKAKGKVIYNFNYDTDGYFFGWKWFKEDVRVKFTKLWWFKPSRVSSRMIAHYIKTNKEQQHKYHEWRE
ncbi:MAG: hypothetical protein WCP46_00665 [Alphaproteobacteria bacterium]